MHMLIRQEATIKVVAVLMTGRLPPHLLMAQQLQQHLQQLPLLLDQALVAGQEQVAAMADKGLGILTRHPRPVATRILPRCATYMRCV